MRVFLSWSGTQTQQLAHDLKAFLDITFAGHVETFVSDADVAPGVRFTAAISSNLDAADLGLLLVTRANQTALWLLFEAGALAGKSAEGSVVPILLDLERSELLSPLDQFQNVLGTSVTDFKKLMERIRNSIEPTPDPRTIEILFDSEWPQLTKSITAARSPVAAAKPSVQRSERDMLSEILLGVNTLVRDLAASNATLPSTDHVLERMQAVFDSAGKMPSSQIQNDTSIFRRGQIVEHEDFGTGVIGEITGAGDKRVAQINFINHGPKKILLRIAPIRIDDSLATSEQGVDRADPPEMT